MLSRKQQEKEEKDPGMSYTRMVMEAIRNQGEPPASSEGAADWEELKKKQWDRQPQQDLCGDQSHSDGYCTLARSIDGKIAQCTTFETPVEGWVEGTYHPTRKPGRMIVLPIPEAAEVFPMDTLGGDGLAESAKKV